jgi:hemerythrin superfamily protein
MSGDTAAGRFPELNKAGDSGVIGDRPKAHLSKEATDQTRRLASEVQDQTGKLVSQVGRHVGRLLTEQKNRAADGLHRVAVVLRDKARNLGQQNDDAGTQIANYTNRAAARMDSMGTYMRGTDLPTMLRDAGRFARRPEVWVVGTVVTGLVVACVLKASRREAPKPWRSGSGRWDDAIQKGAQVVSSAADTLTDTLRKGARARGLSSLSSKTLPGSRLGKYIAIVGDRLVDRIVGGNMKATTLLKNDHTAVKKLFAEFGRTTVRAAKRRQALIDEIAQELDIHSTIEEEIFYPAVKTVRGGQSLVSEAKSEHKKVDSLVAETQGMSMETDEVVQKVEELRDAVIHHATEEEREMFPVAEEGLGARLQKLGEQMAARKKDLQTSRLQKAKRLIKKALRKTA